MSRRVLDERIICSAWEDRSIIGCMTRGQRIAVIASVIWLIIISVIAISRPREQLFFVFYCFGALPVALAWLIYLLTQSRLFRS